MAPKCPDRALIIASVVVRVPPGLPGGPYRRTPSPDRPYGRPHQPRWWVRRFRGTPSQAKAALASSPWHFFRYPEHRLPGPASREQTPAPRVGGCPTSPLKKKRKNHLPHANRIGALEYLAKRWNNEQKRQQQRKMHHRRPQNSRPPTRLGLGGHPGKARTEPGREPGRALPVRPGLARARSPDGRTTTLIIADIEADPAWCVYTVHAAPSLPRRRRTTTPSAAPAAAVAAVPVAPVFPIVRVHGVSRWSRLEVHRAGTWNSLQCCIPVASSPSSSSSLHPPPFPPFPPHPPSPSHRRIPWHALSSPVETIAPRHATPRSVASPHRTPPHCSHRPAVIPAALAAKNVHFLTLTWRVAIVSLPRATRRCLWWLARRVAVRSRNRTLRIRKTWRTARSTAVLLIITRSAAVHRFLVSIENCGRSVSECLTRRRLWRQQ